MVYREPLLLVVLQMYMDVYHYCIQLLLLQQQQLHSATKEAAREAGDADPGWKCGSISRYNWGAIRIWSGNQLETMDHHPVLLRIHFQSTENPSSLYPDRLPNSGIQLGWNRMTFQWIGIQLWTEVPGFSGYSWKAVRIFFYSAVFGDWLLLPYILKLLDFSQISKMKISCKI